MRIYNVQLDIIEVTNEDIFDKVQCTKSLVIQGEDSLIGALYEMKLRITETINQLQDKLS